MKENFIKDNFLLYSDLAKQLYADFAAALPIIDYHCHLPADQIAANHKFENITKIWLEGDHYKWRAMRTLGVEEKFITGEASDRDKFQKWAESVPYTLRNPLYHWTHMELKNPFDINLLLNEKSAQQIFDQTNEKLTQDNFSTQGLLTHFNVEMVGTTDDPADDLNHHKHIQTSTFGKKVLPSFRPDKSFNISGGNEYRNYLNKLSQTSKVNIHDIDSLLKALITRIHDFHACGCRISDHGLSFMPTAGKISLSKLEQIFKEVIDGDDHSVSEEVKEAFTFHILSTLSLKYHELDWTQQFHLGAFRNTNSRSKLLLGADTGFDSIGDYKQGEGLWKFLDHLQQSDQLPRTIIYNLNPSDNALFASMIGNFQEEGVKGKIQFGSAWWFLDQLDGMKQQVDTLSNLGLLSCFIGMLTDSRSFLSYSRHEYFRRMLCNIFAEDIKSGLLPNDIAWLGKIIADICYHNAKSYFKI